MFPAPTPLTTTVQNLLEVEVDIKYNLSDKVIKCVLGDNADAIYQWRRTYLRENKEGICPTLTSNMGTGGHNVPLININTPIAKTLLASMHKMHKAHTDNYYTNKNGLRRLTPRECLRLMGFPESFKIVCSDTQTYKQAGNSIVVNVLRALLLNIYKELNNQ